MDDIIAGRVVLGYSFLYLDPAEIREKSDIRDGFVLDNFVADASVYPQ